MLVMRVLEESELSRSEIAESAGLSKDSLDSWAGGRRVPRRGSLLQLAAGLDDLAVKLEDRADKIRRLAGDVRTAAEE